MTQNGTPDFGYWDNQVERVRRLTAQLVGSRVDEIAFVKNTSQGLSFVANGLDWKAGDEVLIPDLEFPSNVYPWMNLQRLGVRVRKVRNTKGRYTLPSFEKALSKRTRLISVSSVEFVNGFRQDLSALGALCKKKKILFCVDAIQSLGLIPMDVKKYNIDFLCADGHKWLVGPEGLGFFYCKKNRIPQLKLVSVGWHSIINDHNFSTIDFRLKKSASRFEEGSHNTLSIMALGASIEYLQGIGIGKIGKRVFELTDILMEGLEQMGFSVLSSKEKSDRSGSVLFSVGSPKQNRQLFTRLTKNRILVSLRGPGIRVSPHFYNSEKELEKFFQIVKRRGK